MNNDIFYFNGELYIEVEQNQDELSVCSGCCFESRGCLPFNFSKCKASNGYIFKTSPWGFMADKLKYYDDKAKEEYNQKLKDLKIEYRMIKREEI